MSIESGAPAAAAVPGGSVDAKPADQAKPNDPGVQDAGKKETAEERKWRLKFGKTEREVTEKELIAEAQKGWASDEKFKQAKAIERKVKEALENGDVGYLIQKMKGKDQIEYAKEVLKAELKKRSMSPEEREMQERQERLDRLKQEEEEILNKREAEKQAERVRHYEEQYDRELASAIEKHKIPKNKYVIGRAVKIASEIVDMNLEPDWDLVVGEAKRQVQEELWEFIDQMDDFGVLGEDRAKKISKWLVNKGMPKASADKEAVKIVKQEDQKPEKAPVDAEEYWEKKRAQWSK